MNKRLQIIVSAEALRDMIGGDAEVEVKIRQGIADEFARKYIKSLVNESTVQAAVEDVKRIVNEMADKITEKDFTREGWSRIWRPKPELAKLVEEVVNNKIQNIINDTISKRVSELNFTELISKQIDKSIKYKIDQGITNGINEILARLKEGK